MKNVQISLDETILSHLDADAKNSGLNRSAFITLLYNQWSDARKKESVIKDSANDILDAFKEVLAGHKEEAKRLADSAEAKVKSIQ